MRLLPIALVSGLTLGGTYALIALGLVQCYRSTHVFNFAHGYLMLLGALLAGRWVSESDWPFFLAFALALVVCGIVAALINLVVLQRLVGQPLFLGVVATLGVGAILEGAIQMEFPSAQYTLDLPGVPDSTVSLFGTRVSTEELTIGGFSILLALAVAAVLRFTSSGRRMRAAGQDPLLAELSGIDVRRTHVAAWALSGMLACVAGVVYGSTIVITPSLANVALVAFPALLLGGIDSVEGSLLGGVAVGVLQGFVSAYWGGEYVFVATYSLLLVVLLVLPHGLFGTRTVQRV
jgi:branched-chain amino acid transport system permease protein